MDVRCEKCKTEYEFEDSRISDAGVTVKCTSCGYVFKVKKKPLTLTVPVRADDGAPPLASAAERQREWKVRQGNGNVFNFKELTTLQKWIVERKVSRDDEISLTGESWKRLGNIAELASFFQVVDEALRAQAAPPPAPMQLNAPMLNAPMMMGPPSGGYALPSVPGPAMGNSQPQAINLHVTTGPPPPLAPITQERPARTRSSVAPMPMELDHDLKQAGVKGGALKWILILLVLALIGGAGYGGYFYVWLPEQQRRAEIERQKAELIAKQKADEDSASKAQAEAEKNRLDKERADADAKAKAAAIAAAAAAAADAGSADATVQGPNKKETPHDFDWWMARADRLRESDRPEAALDAYGKASELEPDRAEPIAGKGLALNDMGHPLQAEASFERALSINPRYGDAIIGLAETYKAQGRKQDAIRYYQKYLDEIPSGSDASVARSAIKKLQE